MTPAFIETILLSAHNNLNALRRAESIHDQNAALADLMDDAYDLGRAISTSPKLLSDDRVRRLLDEAASVLVEPTVTPAAYPWTIVSRFEGDWEANEWEQLCVARSGLQFFLDLLRESAAAERIALVDASEVDDFIRLRGEDEGYRADSEIPPEIPASHWWWWYPEKPRRR